MDVGLLHVQGPVAAWAEVPCLKHCGVALGFQLPGDPFGPGSISFIIADKEVFGGFLSQSIWLLFACV